MVDEESISGGGRPDNDGLDFRLFELKADVTGRVLVEGQRSLEWPVHQRKNIRNNIMADMLEKLHYHFRR